MYKIGITGGIGTGKSTVSEYLKSMGHAVIEADLVAREAVAPGMPAYTKIVECFGKAILLENGELNRKELARIVFSDPVQLKKLNEITHPEIIRMIQEKVKEIEQSGLERVFIDAALMLETGLDQIIDEIWVVEVPVQIRTERVAKRDSLEKEEVHARIKSQMPSDILREMATVVIDNSKGVEELKKTLNQLLAKHEIIET